MKSKYYSELTRKIDETRIKIAREYQFALDSQKTMVKQ